MNLAEAFALLALILSLLSLIVEVVRLTVEVMEKIYQKKNFLIVNKSFTTARLEPEKRAKQKSKR